MGDEKVKRGNSTAIRRKGQKRKDCTFNMGGEKNSRCPLLLRRNNALPVPNRDSGGRTVGRVFPHYRKEKDVTSIPTIRE